MITSLLHNETIYHDLYKKYGDVLERAYVDKEFVYLLYRYYHEICYANHKSEMEQALTMFKDELSRQTFFRILAHRISGIDYGYDIIHSPEYYPNEIKQRMSEKEVFLDCGAYNGDTIISFREETNDKFDAIYAFEMDNDVYDELVHNPCVCDKRIILFNKGVNDYSGVSTYRKRRFSSSCVLDGTGLPDCAEFAALDDLIEDGTITKSISFVKMDIEGAEINALRGMRQMIRRDKPKLAICLYHKPEDLWEIPLYIKELCCDYNFILRYHHHRSLMWDFVLYAYL